MSKSLPFTSWKDENGQVPVEITMVGILASICVVIFSLTLFQTPVKDKKTSRYLPSATLNPAKREFEQFALVYTVIWILLFGMVVATGIYEYFDENSYMQLCTALAAPFLLQPIVFPMKSEKDLPLFERYSFKANVWIAIFSFIGNYWYTHYFYSVLQAKYTFPAHRLNDVPIALFFATHFYFVTYHTFSNILLRKVETSFQQSFARTILFWTVIFAFAYFTAFMESLSISAFPYYSFQDKYMAYTLGSAFYGIYFIVSYPVFYSLDENNNMKASTKVIPHSLYQTVMEALGASMLVLCFLDFCRIFLNIPLVIPGKAFYVYKPVK